MKVEGVKYFSLWPLADAAVSCFGVGVAQGHAGAAGMDRITPWMREDGGH